MGSIMFEVVEVSLQHMFPNFNECWWDHLGLDVFGCNLLGMVCGMMCVRFPGAEAMGLVWPRARKAAWPAWRYETPCTPICAEEVDGVQMASLFDLAKALICFVVSVLLTVGELNAFFLKASSSSP